MNRLLVRWNALDQDAAARTVLPCCGSHAWAAALADARPFATVDELLATSSTIWRGLPQEAWQEAFDSHPRIGERKAQAHASAESLNASAQEQALAFSAEESAKLALKAANQRYEERFGRIFIVCANGRSAGEILSALERRMPNDAAAEIVEAAEQQRQITELRLKRWLEAE